MSTVTAIIVVGEGHRFHGGIIPAYQLTLTENSRPALTLGPASLSGEAECTWIPTLENMADDAMLMIAACIAKDRAITAKLKVCRKKGCNLELYDISEKDRLQLYAKARTALGKTDMKLVVSVLRGSSLTTRLEALEAYAVEMEVLTAAQPRRSVQRPSK